MKCTDKKLIVRSRFEPEMFSRDLRPWMRRSNQLILETTQYTTEKEFPGKESKQRFCCRGSLIIRQCEGSFISDLS